MLGKRGDMCTCDMWGKYSRLGCRSRKMTQGGVAYKDPISPEKEIHSVWMTLETDETHDMGEGDGEGASGVHRGEWGSGVKNEGEEGVQLISVLSKDGPHGNTERKVNIPESH